MAKEVAKSTSAIDFDTLDPKIQEALMAIGVNSVSEVHDVEELTGGWRNLRGRDSKSVLVGVPFTIVKMSFNDSDYGKVNGEVTGQFVVLHIITDKDMDKYVIVDGGGGIYDSCQKWVANHGDPAGKWITCPYGLRVSQYTYTDKETGEESPAATYYFG